MPEPDMDGTSRGAEYEVTVMNERLCQGFAEAKMRGCVNAKRSTDAVMRRSGVDKGVCTMSVHRDLTSMHGVFPEDVR
jgi:hypothetical protein